MPPDKHSSSGELLPLFPPIEPYGTGMLDLDRPLAERGGGPLDADCFGGAADAAELAVEELVALIAEAVPDELVSAGAQ